VTPMMAPEEELDAWTRWVGADHVSQAEQDQLQALHDARAAENPNHDRGGCWCCCWHCRPAGL
jgi:hypothetical protein